MPTTTTLLLILFTLFLPFINTFNTTSLMDKVLASMMANSNKFPPGVFCDFEDECMWKWNTTVNNGFRVVTAAELLKNVKGYKEPAADADNHTEGHFLYWEISPGETELHVWSPEFSHTRQQCRLHVSLNMVNMTQGLIKLVVEAKNYTSWLVEEMSGNSNNKWQTHVFIIGKITQDFRIFLEVSPNRTFHSRILIDNIKLVNCFPETLSYKPCSRHLFHCSKESDDFCINRTQVCDIIQDCWNGEDERQGCDLVPDFARCTFEDGWCAWENSPTSTINWTRQNGSTSARRITGPDVDHTYQNLTGIFLYVNMSTKPSTKLGASAVLESPLIHPPPLYHSRPNSTYFKSCYVRFYYHQFGPNSGSLGLFLSEKKPTGDKSDRLWFTYGDKGDKWQRQLVAIPTNITNPYVLQFEARRGLRARGDVAIDDLSMSPECFGLNVPEEEKGDYNYSNFSNFLEPTPPAIQHVDFINKTVYSFSSCGAKGRFGPTPENCTTAYNGTNVNVTVLEDAALLGVQRWTVPEEGYYTIIAKGASGGKGSDGYGFSKGATAIGVVQLNRTQSVYIIVGHEGGNACHKNFAFTKHSTCGASLKRKKYSKSDALKEIKNIDMIQEGGGGGGASVVFLWSKKKGRIPLVIGAGGGGLGESGVNDGFQHGQDMQKSRIGVTGVEAREYNMSAGAGGGWSESNMTWRDVTGQAIILGAIGGKACATSFDHHGHGGFGGGGGGCITGGGGGGYAGGSSYPDRNSNGYGGYSYAWHMLNTSRTTAATHIGQGKVMIIPAIKGCGCRHRCAALDENMERVTCLCPQNQRLSDNGADCIFTSLQITSSTDYLLIALAAVCSISLSFTICAVSYRHYRHIQKKKQMMRMKKMNESELQLNRLRVASDMMTEYNPNYEFGGGTYTIRDLNEIPRNQLRLVKALGQGAFGEVYQGFYRHRAGDILEMPVAVKTLPELSTSQAETDFLMEALIMSKFNHPNIVHFIGVCFDRHPRLIVLELLAGGDLKNFLRESRPKPDRPSPLTMKDLLMCCLDVAKGCAYLEEHRFIHRDIAARNCLLTTKGPGRTTKIADFGMARDIYRSDYYKKGGKAMLPIKWMPPEAFHDGIFTSRTDVWSFGVLMWEVMSLGYMPYTGCGNREVIQLVSRGGRLEPPHNCPVPVYALMTKCWHPTPEERPSFKVLIERLGYLLQDPEVLSSPLPVFNRLTWSERDSAIQSAATSRSTLRGSTDYLEPTTTAKTPDSAEWQESYNSESALVQSLLDEPTSAHNTNHNNNNNSVSNGRRPLISALSLDASTLVKQPGRPTEKAYSVHNTPCRDRFQDKEISC